MTEHDSTSEASPEPDAVAAPAGEPQPDHPRPESESTAAAPERIVYVTTPPPPRTRGSRAFGASIAVASSAIFTILYGLLAALFIGIGGSTALGDRLQAFAQTPSFWMPVIAYTVGYVLLALVINRAGWWAHVLGGFLVAALVYAVFLASTVVSAQAVGAAPVQVQQFLLLQVTNPLGWAAAIAAREVPIWVGGLVARHGRAATARNIRAREAYLSEREQGGAASAV